MPTIQKEPVPVPNEVTVPNEYALVPREPDSQYKLFPTKQIGDKSQTESTEQLPKEYALLPEIAEGKQQDCDLSDSGIPVV